MTCNDCYERVERRFRQLFSRYGRFISRHAWKTIIICVIVNAGLGVGIMRLKSDTDTGNVYYPQGSKAREDKAKVENIFPDLSGSSFNSLQLSKEAKWARIIVKSTSGNLLRRTVLEEIGLLSQSILNLTAIHKDGSEIKISKFCARSHYECSVEGDLFWREDFLNAVDIGTVTFPQFGNNNYASYIGGKPKLDITGQYLLGMEYIMVGFMIRTDSAAYTEAAEQWVDTFVAYMEKFSSSNFEIAYGHFNSINEELDKNVSGDIRLFSITFTLMITYACLSTTSARLTDQVGQRLWLGFAGILAAGFAVISAFGFCAALGVQFVSIVGVLPFLIIGIGIDDMFILLSGLSEAQAFGTVEDRIAETLKTSGVGITITSLTDIIAFMAGMNSIFLGVKNFCIYTGVAVVFCYINNITFFVACMTINERRVLDNRHFISCNQIRSKEQLEQEGKSKTYIMCCGGTGPRNRAEAEGVFDRFPRWFIPKLLFTVPKKITIVLLFFGYLGAGIYGCVKMKQGLLLANLVSEDSYFYRYSKWDEEYFPRQTPVSFVITNSYQYSSNGLQTAISSMIHNIHSNGYFDSTFEVNWLSSYMASPYFNNETESAFILGLQSFVLDPRFSRFYNDFIISKDKLSLISSRFYVLSAKLADSQEQGKMMLESRSIAESAGFDCIAFSPYFLAFEQYVAILGQSLQTVGIAIATVFLVTCIFMPHPILIIFVTIAVTMIMVGVFGYLLFINVSLSAITMIHLIMSVGFSVDFTAHICHGYMVSTRGSRTARVIEAIDKTGAPIFHGAISSFLGIIVLFWAKSYIFRTFGIVMSFVLLFGITHALLLLPVVLSTIGPEPRTIRNENTAAELQHLATG